MDGGAGALPTVRKQTPAREHAAVCSQADANAAPLERDNVSELQLPPATPIDLAVHGHVAIDDGLFNVPAGVEEPGELQELAEADAVATDRDVVDRSGVGHAEMLADVGSSGCTGSPSLSATRDPGSLGDGGRLVSVLPMKRSCDARPLEGLENCDHALSTVRAMANPRNSALFDPTEMTAITWELTRLWAKTRISERTSRVMSQDMNGDSA